MALPEGVSDILPLTGAQTGMLFHVLETSAVQGRYVAVVSCTITGALEVDRFRTAFQDAVNARDAYRAAFVWEGVKQPVQAIRDHVDVPLTVVDWRGADDMDARLNALLQTEQTRQFNLKRAPLMAATLVQRADQEWTLIWTIHHLISDGWSTGVVLRDMCARYADPASPRARAASFKSYLVWLHTKAKPFDRGYWSQHLSGLQGPCILPLVETDASSGQNHIETELGADLLGQVETLATSLRVTTHAVLSATWALVLRRLHQENDVIFGHTTSGRPPEIPGIAEAAGAFLNTLPLRVTIDPDQSLALFVQQHARDVLERAAHEYATLADVQKLADLPTGGPLFDTVFVNEGLSETAQKFGELHLSGLKTRQSSNYAMAFLVHPQGPFRVELYTDPQKCPLEQAERVVSMFGDALTSLVSEPQAKIRDLFWKSQLAVPAPPETPVPSVLDRILAQVEITPNAPAVTDDTETLTYSELVTRAGGIAQLLRERGVTQTDIVPVLLPRGGQALVGFLGVMMAGAAYVPIDLTYPEERIAQVFEAVAPRFCLSHRGSKAIGGMVSVQNVHIEDASDHAPDEEVTTGRLAYVIFTSGSQGRPKGVMISHQTLAISTAQRDLVYGASPESYLLLSSLSFDSSVAGIYWTLATGGHLVVAPHHIEQSPNALGALIRTHAITHTLCLPSLAQALVSSVPEQDLQSLRVLITAGEALFSSVVTECRAVLLNCQIVNEYGPTEATVWCTAYDATDAEEGAQLPIGHSLPATWVGVVDHDGVPLSTGEIGEIVVAGPTLADGYLNNEEETQRRFPVLGPEKTRVYRTGDLGRVNPDGTLSFLGRRDTQVKIRGHRVETAEIEHVAAAVLPGVDVAVAANNTPSGTTLDLFVEANADVVPTVKAAIEAALPDPFHPARTIALSPFPRLPNGKIDRAALTAHAAPVAEAIAPSVPQNTAEAALVTLFSDVLTESAVTRETNFFDAGGDSLLTLALFSKGRDRGLIFEPKDVFANPTPEKLAQHLLSQAGQHHDHKTSGLVQTTHEEGQRTPVFFVHASTNLLSQVARGLGLDHPVGLLFSHHVYQSDVPFDQTIEDLAREAVSHLRALKPDGPYVLCGFSIGCAVVTEICAQLGEEEVAGVFLLDPPFDLLPRRSAPHASFSGRVAAMVNVVRNRVRLLRYAVKIPAVRRQLSSAPENEDVRLGAVRMAYRAATTRYRVPRIAHQTRVFTTTGNPALASGGTLDQQLEDKLLQNFELNHEDLVHDPEAVLQIAASLIAAAKSGSR